MSYTNLDTIENGAQVGSGWNNLYRLAGVGVLVSLGLMLLDIGLSFAGWDVQVGDMDSAGWFDLYRQNPFIGLRNLGLFNVISLIVSIPLYLALYNLHRRTAPAFAALALALFLFGASIYVSSNRALPMLALSNQYASAQTEAEKTLLETAGTITLAQGEDFTPGTILGFLLNSLGSITMMVVMLAGRVFGKRIALTGLVGASCLLVFTVSVTFAPQTMPVMMILALAGGLLMLGWNVAVARVMFRLGGQTGDERERLLASAG